MRIPAQAFGEGYPQNLEPGRLFKTRGLWALRVAYGNQSEIQGFVSLEGDNAGQLFELRPGMARGLTIVHPFGWFPAVASDAQPQHDAFLTATLTIGPTGPVIIGADIGGYDPDYIAFGLDGRESVDYEQHGGVVRFAQWSAELQHADWPLKSLGTIIIVDRSAKD